MSDDMPSNVIWAMRYEPRRRELLIVFHGGRGMYRYFNVPVEEWGAFLEAESKGAYLNEVFKRKEHPYIRLMEPVSGASAGDFSGFAEVAGIAEDRQLGVEPLEWGESWSLPRPGVQKVGVDERAEKIRA